MSILPCKITFLGKFGSGKTCIIERYLNNKFDPRTKPSSGGCYSSKTIELENEKNLIKLEIWDTVGREQFRTLTKVIYKDAVVIILVYDITRKDSFDELKSYWINAIKENNRSDFSKK